MEIKKNKLKNIGRVNVVFVFFIIYNVLFIKFFEIKLN